jgi:hypothetical protein
MTELPPISSDPANAVEVGARIDDLLPGRSLLVTRVGVDQVAIRVRYEIRPPVPLIGDEDRIACVAWLLNARDDAGGEYTDWGGAFGASPDGTFTDGVRSLQPVPPPGATFLNLEFAPSEGVDAQRVVLRVPLSRHHGIP